MQRKVLGLSLAIVLCLTAVAQAIPTIVVGNHNLLPNTAGQSVPITISGIDPGTVNGAFLSVQIGDGNGVGNTGPSLTSFQWSAPPTIFNAPNTPSGLNAQTDDFGQGDQLANSGVLTVSGFTNQASGLLVTLIVDTSGINGGVFDLLLTGGLIPDFLGDTDILSTEFENITNGTLTVVPIPEPSSVVLGLFAIAGLGAVAIRKRRARRA